MIVPCRAPKARFEIGFQQNHRIYASICDWGCSVSALFVELPVASGNGSVVSHLCPCSSERIGCAADDDSVTNVLKLPGDSHANAGPPHAIRRTTHRDTATVADQRQRGNAGGRPERPWAG